MKRSPCRTGRYASRKYGARKTSNSEPVRPSTVSEIGSTAIRLACGVVSCSKLALSEETYVFDIGACMYCDNVAVLDSEIVPNHTVHPGASIIKVIVRQHDQNCILSLLAFHQDGVSSKKLQRFHGVVRESDDRVIVIDCICDAVATTSVRSNGGVYWKRKHTLGNLASSFSLVWRSLCRRPDQWCQRRISAYKCPSCSSLPLSFRHQRHHCRQVSIGVHKSWGCE